MALLLVSEAPPFDLEPHLLVGSDWCVVSAGDVPAESPAQERALAHALGWATTAAAAWIVEAFHCAHHHIVVRGYSSLYIGTRLFSASFSIRATTSTYGSSPEPCSFDFNSSSTW